ncbi:phage minor tail protein L [Cedecea lapagei]|uniref:Phage minor tail protein L n=1 Tax=Cedecea lapagei TaxID=158823 RepID=A0A447V1K8_9ENTR|nr:phage minor tail protein L [Cedecea lapagei]
MRDIPAELIIESVDAGVGAFIDLFEADLQPYGGDVVRFHSGANGFYTDVIWKGRAYPAYPIAVEGFEMKNEGTYARPTMAVANVSGLITGINSDFDDMLGVVITRRQVPVKHLDAVNFPNGNPDADPTKEAVSRYIVEEMTEETFEQVTYSLATPVDCDNAIIPARTILADVCQWVYRGGRLSL